MSFRLALLLLVLSIGGYAQADLAVVTAGKPAAVIVTPVEPLPIVAYAAEELAYHLEKSTGAKLAVVAEDALPAAPANRLYLGATAAATAAGLGQPGREECVLKTQGNALFICGDDTTGELFAQDTRAGTLWGVYELAERVLGARWLWPGELGLVIKKLPTVAFADYSETVKPRMLQRNVRPGLRWEEGPFPSFSAKGRASYARDQQVFLRRHRMGRSMPLKYGHAFPSWWKSDGEKHPEWFQLLEDGKRGPSAPGRTFSMCVSNKEFQQEIINRWRQFKADNPGGPTNVNGTENDIGGMCTCAECMAMDGPQVDEGTDIYQGLKYRRVSDRYAKFWLALHDLAVKEDPEARVMGYAYINYFPKPSESIKLNRNILVGMCPWPGMWFPRTDREQEWLKEQWAGWARTGASVFLRPNTTLDGYAMPHNYARQFADEFQHYAKNNMVATDFDSLTGQWATQGTTLYLLMRLHVRPERPVDELLGEYYAAFGPAAQEIKAYFDYWEDYTTKNRTRLETALAKQGASRYRQHVKAVAEAYPPECFVPAQEMIRRAVQAAQREPLFAARVAFVQKGLTHAMLCRELSAAMAGTDEAASPMAAQRALAKLGAFRLETEADNVANYVWCAAVEQRSYQAPVGYGGEPVKPMAEQVAPLSAEATPVPVRGQATFIARLAAGQQFEARLENRKLGKNPDPASWRLFGPDDKLVTQGLVEVGKTEELAVAVPAPGTYLLEVNSKGNVLRTMLLNDHAAVVGQRLGLASSPTRLFFRVPEGLGKFKLMLTTQTPGETALLRIFDSEGREVASGSTVEVASQVAEVTVPAGQAGKVWSVQVERAAKGVLEDFALTLDKAVPGFWASAADRLVVPE